MNSVIHLFSFNDYVGYMIHMHKKGYRWSDGTPLTPASYEEWDVQGRGTYVLENYKSKTISRVSIEYVTQTPPPNIIPYFEITNYVGYPELIKRDLNAEMLTEKESRIINRKVFDTLVNQPRTDDVRDQYRIVKKEYTTSDKDDITNPSHYTTGGIEPIKYIQSHSMNFEKGNVIKYVTRAGKKEGQNEVKDLKKARQYLDFLIGKLEEGVWESDQS
ncbi:TPA: DUF3310 domain-containing protein [Listeria monocytogenes]|uniref:DUF3310 domain-containing protein n=3 Tax=Listeria monocytogenes TaxID=1639 RepID=A0A3T2CUX1_LISMN|nr:MULTISPECIES: DUF3310 domain-containing protein [Listeria]MDA35576.1 DUF3310 domain-containing protein [Listeria monocytogenes serotype 1/2a]EAA0273960.1 DUF3310 domain-containing protein [Listeria monocytogenes]EAC2241093.1 DUF3310 domain-containing protein [Listeria monocytogenes]EAC2669680.1 DUF3310 domain-containing protein [Listeria monocytogenes]EAC2977260.1 DUF3310 domain-containing protein [Listeria monocytogenes]